MTILAQFSIAESLRLFLPSLISDVTGKSYSFTGVFDSKALTLTRASPEALTQASPEALTHASPEALTQTSPEALTLASPEALTHASPELYLMLYLEL